jgi:hypothetical protein
MQVLRVIVRLIYIYTVEILNKIRTQIYFLLYCDEKFTTVI